MNPKPDITTRKDIEVLVSRFYEKVRNDDTIGFIFSDIAQVNWDHHLPVMFDFWEMVLLGSGGYKGDTMTSHIQLNKKIELKPVYFQQWLKLFNQTLDENFSGPKTNEARDRANNIANLISFRVSQSAHKV
ncbi:MAG TPA: group III truncated hemoglobin [Cyclobacteriaceae bacterium]|nr:group III truncated hemoglobin [Cyclobacteriaceae bacterium]